MGNASMVYRDHRGHKTLLKAGMRRKTNLPSKLSKNLITTPDFVGVLIYRWYLVPGITYLIRINVYTYILRETRVNLSCSVFVRNKKTEERDMKRGEVFIFMF